MVGAAAVQLDLPEHYRMHNVFHVSLTSRYRESGRVQPPVPEVDTDDLPVWQVDKVLTHKWRKTAGKERTEYLVQWHGQSPDDATWVDEPDLDSSELLAYWAGHHDDRPHAEPVVLLPDGLPADSKVQNRPRRGRPPKRLSKKTIINLVWSQTGAVASYCQR